MYDKMATYVEDPFIAEAAKQSAALIASSDASLKKCKRKVEVVDKKFVKVDASLERTEAHFAELKAMRLCPSMYMAAKKLPEAEFQLRCIRYKLAEETKEKEKLKGKYQEANVLERRARKENKELKQTFDELTAELSGEVKTMEMNEKTAMMDELASLREQLAVKCEENKKQDKQILEMAEEIKIYKETMKKQDIQVSGLKEEIKVYRESTKKQDEQTFELKEEIKIYRESTKNQDKQMSELKEDIEAYQKASEEGYAKRHAANEAYTAELEEAYAVVTKQRDVLHDQLDEMRVYANHAVTMANNAWRDGADTMEYLRAQLHAAAAAQKGLVVREWCVDVGGSSTLVSGSETWKASDTSADSEKDSAE